MNCETMITYEHAQLFSKTKHEKTCVSSRTSSRIWKPFCLFLIIINVSPDFKNTTNYCLALQTIASPWRNHPSFSVENRKHHNRFDSKLKIRTTRLFMVLQGGQNKWKTRRRDIDNEFANRTGNHNVNSGHLHSDLKLSLTTATYDKTLRRKNGAKYTHSHTPKIKGKYKTAHFNQLLQKITRTRTIKAVKEAESMLFQMLERNTHRGDTSLSNIDEEDLVLPLVNPDIISFNIVLTAWSKVRSKGASSNVSLYCAEQAQCLFQKMQAISGINPDSYTYGAVMNAVAKSGELGAARRVEQLLKRLEDTNPNEVNVVLYNILLDALAREASISPSVNAIKFPLKCEQVLNQMTKQRSSFGIHQHNLSPTTISFNCCLKAWANVQSSESPKRIEALLNQMMQSKNENARPNTISVSTAISCYSQAGDAQKAEDLLHEMESGKIWGPNVVPDVITYSTVISAWAKSGHINGAQHALKLLDYMIQTSSLPDQGVSSSIAPNIVTYNTALSALANHPKGLRSDFCPAEKAEELLEQMRKSHISPDTITFSTIIDIFANQGNEAAALKAEDMLKAMEENWLNYGHVHSRPNAITYSTVIRCWSQALCQEEVAPQRATAILDRLEKSYLKAKKNRDYVYAATLKPNLIIFNTVIECWSKSRDEKAVEAIDKLITRMERLHKEEELENIIPDATTYSFVINAWTKLSQGNNKLQSESEIRVDELLREIETSYDQGVGRMKPTPLLYSAVAQAYAKMSSEEGAIKAESLLRRNKKKFKESPEKYAHMKPNNMLFNAVIDAYARVHTIDSALRAEAILKELIEVETSNEDPNLKLSTRSFNAAILAWKNCGDPKLAHEKSEALLKEMNKMYQDGKNHVKPDKCTINSYIDVLAKVGKAQTADDFLQFMEKMYLKKGDVTLKPDIISFNTCLDAWSNYVGTDVNVKEKVDGLLSRLRLMMHHQEDLKPDLITLYSILKANNLLQSIKDNPKNDDKKGSHTFHAKDELGNGQSSSNGGKLDNAHAVNWKCKHLLNAIVYSVKNEDRMGDFFKNNLQLFKLFIDVLDDSSKHYRSHDSDMNDKLQEIDSIYLSLVD